MAAKKKKRVVPLTEAQVDYLTTRLSFTDDLQLARGSGVPVARVREFRAKFEAAQPPPPESLFDRRKQNTVVMTEAAAMAGDEIRKRAVITQAEIDAAAGRGDYERAAQLAKLRAEGGGDKATLDQAKYGNYVHFMQKDRGIT